MLTRQKLYILFHSLPFIFILINLVGCSSLDMYKTTEPPKNLATLVIDCKHLSTHSDYLEFEDTNKELLVFIVKKPYLLKIYSDTILQNLAFSEQEKNYEVLSYHSYSLVPKQIINDKIELLKNAYFLIFFLKKQNEAIAREVIKVIPKKTKAINVELIGEKIKITKNT
jgi:hypothetical protein